MAYKKIIFVLLIILQAPALVAKVFTVRECIDYALANNSQILIAKLESEFRKKQVKEKFGTGLPQIDGTATYTYNIKLMTLVMTGEGGTSVPVTIGYKHDLLANLTLTQKVFDWSFWVGLKAAKLSAKFSEESIKNQEEETIYSVVYAYYFSSILQKQLNNLIEISDASFKRLNLIEIKYKYGAIRKIELDKAKVSYFNVKSQLNQAEINYVQSLNNLKYVMNMPLDSNLEVYDVSRNSTDAPNISDTLNNEIIINNRIDYKLQQIKIELQQLDKANNKAAFFPSLSFFGNYNIEAWGDKFDLFTSHKKWYSAAAVGLTLKVPIFSGLSRLARVQQSAIMVEIEKEKLNNLENSINLNVSNYYVQLKNAVDNIQSEKENLDLALLVLNNEQLEFNQGRSTTFDLIQAESSLRETQNIYYSKLLDLYLAELNLEKSKGNLLNYVNNLNY